MSFVNCKVVLIKVWFGEKYEEVEGGIFALDSLTIPPSSFFNVSLSKLWLFEWNQRLSWSTLSIICYFIE